MDNLINDFRTSNAIDRFIFTCEYVTLHSENNFLDEIKNTHFEIGTFFWIMHRGLSPITQILKSMEAFQAAVNQSLAVWGGLTLLLLAWKMEEEQWAKKMQTSSRSWKWQGDRFSPRVSRKEHSTPDTLSLAQWDHLRFLTCRMVKIINYF